MCSLCIVHAHFTSVIICKWWIASTSGIYNFVIIVILMFRAFWSAAAAPEGYIAHRFSFAMLFFGDPSQPTYGMLLFQTHTWKYVRASMVVVCTHIVAEVAHRRWTINSTDDSHSTDISIQKWKTKKWNKNETNIRPISLFLCASLAPLAQNVLRNLDEPHALTHMQTHTLTERRRKSASPVRTPSHADPYHGRAFSALL